MYKYCLFDLDGTLTQSEFGILKAAVYALERFGIVESDKRKLLCFIGPPLYVSFHEYYGLSEEDTELAVAYYREKYESETFTEAPLYDGIIEVLETLKRHGIKLMIVTSKPSDMAKKVIEHVGISDFFEYVFGPGRDNKVSNKESLIKEAMETAAVSEKSDFIMIGDRHYDIEAAVKTCIDSIGAVYGYGSLEELKEAGATYIVESPKDILNYVI